MDKLSRRHLASLSGVLAAQWAVPAMSLAAAPAPQSAQPEPTDLLSQRKANMVRATEELRAFELKYSDEPMIRLVVR